MLLKDKVVLITGASRGIGKQIALQLAQEGADIVVGARTVEAVRKPIPGNHSRDRGGDQSLGRQGVGGALRPGDSG